MILCAIESLDKRERCVPTFTVVLPCQRLASLAMDVVSQSVDTIASYIIEPLVCITSLPFFDADFSLQYLLKSPRSRTGPPKVPADMVQALESLAATQLWLKTHPLEAKVWLIEICELEVIIYCYFI